MLTVFKSSLSVSSYVPVDDEADQEANDADALEKLPPPHF